MLEVIDINSKLKLMAMVVTCIDYMGDRYVFYCIDRGKGEANIFISKLVVTSDGYIFKNDFKNGEKEVLDKVIKRMINKEDISSEGFVMSNNVDFSDINYFDIEKCYVATISKKHIKDIMVYYKLVTQKIFERPVVEVVEDKRFFNEGYVGNLFLILFGVIVVIFCIVVVIGVFL